MLCSIQTFIISSFDWCANNFPSDVFELVRETRLLCLLGVVTVLKYPYPKVVAEPAQYETVRVHAQMGGEKMAANEQALHLAVCSSSSIEHYTTLVQLLC